MGNYIENYMEIETEIDTDVDTEIDGEFEEEAYNKHYIRIDERGLVTDGFSDAFREPIDTDICINETAGYQFRLFPTGEENPQLFTTDCAIPLYKYENGVIVKRSNDEIEEDFAKVSKQELPTQLDHIEAQVTYTAMMTDTLLEE